MYNMGLISAAERYKTFVSNGKTSKAMRCYQMATDVMGCTGTEPVSGRGILPFRTTWVTSSHFCGHKGTALPYMALHDSSSYEILTIFLAMNIFRSI
jgi:hypothetical protein